MNVLLLFALLQADPSIEKIERLSGDVQRPLLWTALKVTVSSAAGFDGRVEAWSSFNVRTAVAVKLAPGGRQTLLLPALDPEAVTAGKSRQEVPRAAVRADRIVLVDDSLPFAAELASTEKAHVKRISVADLQGIQASGLSQLEAVDAVLVGPWMTRLEAPFRRASTLEEARGILDEPLVEAFRIPAVEASLWTRMPDAGWVESKRMGLVYLALVYAALALGLFAAWGRLPRRARFPAAVALPLLLLGGSFVLVPGGNLSVTGQGVTMESGKEYWNARLWYLGAALEGEQVLDFPRLVKPVFPTAAGAEASFVLLIQDGRTRVEGLMLGPRRRAAFAGVERGGAVPPAGRFGVVSFHGGVADPADQAQDPDVQVWSRWLDLHGGFAFLRDREVSGTDVRAPGLAEGRERRPILLERRKP